jgi:5-methylcytosine-specific restriction protein A
LIKTAIEYVLNLVHTPALDHPDLPVDIKNRVRNNKVTIQKFRRVGDLYQYIIRFSREHGGSEDTFNALNDLGLESLETILQGFEAEFKYNLVDNTVLSDFVLGDIYTSYDIANFSKTYDVRQGIYLIGDEPKYEAIFTKVTLGADGSYPNKWLKDGIELKHYIKANKGNFSDNNLEWKHNRAFINSNKNGVPIYVFIKTDTVCKLEGIFEFVSSEKDNDGGMWFRLIKSNEDYNQIKVTVESYEDTFLKQVQKSRASGQKARSQRLVSANKKPKKIMLQIEGYQRNADVVAEVLSRAGGICEGCTKAAPFISKSKNAPYLEVHHKILLSKGGDDSVENAIALCPNCHRERHFGVNFVE